MSVLTEAPAGSRSLPRDWAIAGAAGLGLAYGLFALFGDAVERLGAEHGGVVHGIAAITGLITGGTLLGYLQWRVLRRRVAAAAGIGVVSGVTLAVGFVGGFLLGGPPIDFLLGTIALGTVGSIMQARLLRRQYAQWARYLWLSLAGWLAAGIGATAFAVFAGDAMDGAFGSGLAGFVAVTTSLGLLGGAVGGLIGGRALRRVLTS